MDYIPYLLVLHITGRCNLKCAYCYASSYGKKDLETDTAQNILSQAAKLGTRHVILSGGEALLHPDFYTISEYAKNLGIKVHLTSNGTLIDENNAKKLKALDAIVTISLDGSCSEINDPLRGGGTFDSAIRSINNLIHCGVTTSMRMTLVKDNISDVHNYIDLARQQKVNRCIIERVTGILDNPESFELEPSSKELIKSFEILSKYANIEGIKMGSNDPLWLVYQNNLCKKITGNDHIRGGCTAGVASVTIKPDLTVIPCPRLPVKAGSLNEKSLEDIWLTSKVFLELRNRDLFAGCSSCDSKYICGGCRGAAYSRGSYLAKDPHCWRNG